ncbi:hypothetical protein DESC_140032 [Desulfosarcina cetonica]|uniref:glycosyltransferase family 4 protein n=1 Tax=Desulfosarcina cetonica TaxID=90730 RepID=UPI0006D05942|nr:glycosyltransferase family 4 protein [Desulfosarcina cetonica]VTR64156.1 hypothetical protein DESC_140032 [Desulfosarcina cetonica]
MNDHAKAIVILTGSFPPTNIVGALRPFRLTKELLQQGWRVIILTNPPSPGWALDTALLAELKGDYRIEYVRKTREIGFWSQGVPARIAGTGHDLLRLLLKPDPEILYAHMFCRAFQGVVRNERVNAVLTTSPPHSIQIAGLWIKRRYKIPWIVDYRDPWEYYPTTGHLRLNNPLERYFEEKIAQEADALVSATSTYSANLTKRHPKLPTNRFHTITNTFDSRLTFRPAAKEDDKFIICYTGIFYPEKDPYGFFRALRFWFDGMNPDEVKRYRSKLEIHLIGSRNRPTRETIESLKLEENVIFFDRMPHHQAIEKSLEADMLLISSGLGAQTRPGWLPSKLFEYLGCRVPIFALIREGEMAAIIRETNSGYVVTSEDHIRIAQILKNEMDRKLGCATVEEYKNFTFKGIERFEEKTVMSHFVSLITTCTGVFTVSA